MTSQSGGGGTPGLTPDGGTPPGCVIAGALTAGDPTADVAPTLHTMHGSTTFESSPGNAQTNDAVVLIAQFETLTGGGAQAALQLLRSGALDAFNYDDAVLTIADVTASLEPLARFTKQGVQQFTIDGDGITVLGKFKVGAVVTRSLGSYSGTSVPVSDVNGDLLGYLPVYT